jgi:hypothetical protein
MKKKSIFVHSDPLPVCGHDFPGTLMIGCEEHGFAIHGKKYDYFSSVEQHGCKICNKRAMDKVKRRIRYLMKKNHDVRINPNGYGRKPRCNGE